MERAVEKGDFGKGKRTIVQTKNAGVKGAHFAAAVEFFTVKCNDEEFQVVSKIQPQDEFTRTMMRSNLQFHTEVLMYKEIIPFLKVQDLFPKMYYGQAENNYVDDCILLEDLGPQGFKVTKKKLYISIDHIKMAIKAIARFHAASFNAKATQKDQFDSLVSQLKYEFFADENDTSIIYALKRGMLAHMDKHSELLNPCLDYMMDANKFNKLVSAVKEPWGVICHGDFCRNNMLFKYSDSDEPIDIKLFDLQTSRYTSPAIDLSFFLYLNMDKETRDIYWDEILQLYLDTLKSYLISTIKINDDEFYDDFASRAIYGYLHCSFFTPMMLLDTPPSTENYGAQTEQQRIEFMTNVGGEEATNLITDIVAHLIERGYIQKFLQLVGKK